MMLRIFGFFLMVFSLCCQISNTINNKSISNVNSFGNDHFDWEKIDTPFGKVVQRIVANEDGTIVLAGRSFILLSKDFGKTWDKLQSGIGDDLYTTDGGQSFLKTYDKTIVELNLQDLCGAQGLLLKNNRLFISSVCEHHSELWSISIKDNTNNWHKRSYAPDPKEKSESKYNYYSPRYNFSVSTNGVVIDAFSKKGVSLLATSDNGESWNKIWINRNSSAKIIGVDFITPQIGFVVLNDGKIGKTLDGGHNWTFVSELPKRASENIMSFDFINENRAVVVGANGMIFVTNDGGGSWLHPEIESSANFYKVMMATDQKGWIVGGNSTILETINGGANWKKINVNRELCSDGSTEADYLLSNIDNLQIVNGQVWIALAKCIYKSSIN